MAPLVQFSGLASGIDSAALIEAILDQKRSSRIEPLEDKSAELTETNSILSELKTKLSELQSILRGFSTLNGGGLSKFASSSNAGVADATASSSAANGTYGLTVTQLASNETQSFQSSAGTYTSSSDVVAAGINNGAAAADRTVSFTIGTTSSETVDIELTNTTTLSDVASEFNQKSSKATASVVNAGTAASPDYRLVITSNSEGTAEGSVSVTVGDEIDVANNAFDTITESDATDAQFSLSGVSGTITRNSNTIGDLIPGVTFTLYGTGSATISIESDVESTKENVQDFIETFNEIIQFVDENNLVERDDSGEESTNIFGALSGTQVDDSVIQAIKTAMTNAANGSSSTVQIFADLGITTDRDGTLKFDEDIFEEALAKDSGSVETIFRNFADKVSLTNGTIDNYIRFNGLLDGVINSNERLIENYADRISQTESTLAREEESLTARFARLEALIGEMQAQQTSLQSALVGLG